MKYFLFIQIQCVALSEKAADCHLHQSNQDIADKCTFLKSFVWNKLNSIPSTENLFLFLWLFPLKDI